MSLDGWLLLFLLQSISLGSKGAHVTASADHSDRDQTGCIFSIPLHDCITIVPPGACNVLKEGGKYSAVF